MRRELWLEEDKDCQHYTRDPVEMCRGVEHIGDIGDVQGDTQQMDTLN